MIPIVKDIGVVKLFVSETQTDSCKAQFAHTCFAACGRHMNSGSARVQKEDVYSHDPGPEFWTYTHC